MLARVDLWPWMESHRTATQRMCRQQHRTVTFRHLSHMSSLTDIYIWYHVLPLVWTDMLIRARHVVRASVKFRSRCQPGWWDCRRSCVRDWSSPVCWFGVDTTFPTAGSPAFLFHLRLNIELVELVWRTMGLMSHCYLVLCRRAALSSVITRNVVHFVSRSREANAGVQGDLVFKLNLPAPTVTRDQPTIYAYCSVTSSRPIVR